MQLTERQVDQYRREGYVVVPDVLSSAQVAEGRRIIEQFVERSRSVTESDALFDLEPGHSAERPLVRRLKSPARHDPFFEGLIRSDALLDILESLIGPDIRAMGSKLNLKAAGAGSPVEWHQDFAFHPHTNDDVCAIGVAFDDADLENGCMLFLPGSQRGPVLNHHRDGVFVGAISPTRDGIDLSGAVPVLMPAGSVSVHHGRMLHGSAPNRSARPRRLLLWDIAAADAWPIGADPGDLAAYDELVVRGRPTITPRVEPMPPFRIPKPQPLHNRSIFEIQESAEKAFAG